MHVETIDTIIACTF